MRVLDVCECKEDRVDSLEDEIAHLTQGLERQEIPYPRTEQNVAKFEANLEELRKKLRVAQAALKRTRDANPLPEDERDEVRRAA
jgi:septation ring formation regulator EzrA